MIRNALQILSSIAFIILSSGTLLSQTTTFTYQGKLNDNGVAANGIYLMQFSLFDAPSGGTQIGQTLSFEGGLGPPAVQVTNGIFSVQLDFGVPTPPFDNTPRFDGSPRWIAIAVRGMGQINYSLLSPRQPITSDPYSIRSASASTADTASTATTANNALSLGGVAAAQFVVTTDPRMNDARTPTAGSSNYIQNTTSQQSGSFNISGNGVVGGRFSAGGLVQAGDTMSVISSAANPFAIRAYSSSNGSALAGLITGGNTAFPAIIGQYSGTGTGAGVTGINTFGTGTGVIAAGQGSATSTLVNGSGIASTGFDTGVFAVTTTSGASQAILSSNFGSLVRVNYFNGTTLFKINGAGAVSTVVRDAAEKQRIMFAPEAPEVLLEDYGVGQLINGKASITLDSTFAQNISVNRDHQLRVFVQLEGDCNGVYVSNKSSNGFDVIELSGGRSNVSFSWHVVANRADEVLTNYAARSEEAPQNRISHYADLRFPLQNDDPQILQTQLSARKPPEK